ncbi:hypothetical protein AWV80_09040 [Cupriavidus sp. UYMU48A]|nr:hypothetical protein AWV80_09040 [Cupriavidus sp. UYMU48A]
MTIFAGKRLKVRCPRCKGKSFELSETCEESILFTVENGVMPKEATDHIPGASPASAQRALRATIRGRARSKEH